MTKKVERLREKYGPFADLTFNKLVNGDPSDNSKYTEFLLRTWSQKKTNNCPSSTLELVGYVHAFNALIPYMNIEDRDIYNKKYYDIQNLENVILSAEEKKDELTFNREEHCEVFIETDEYLFLSPKTHRGSLKYGANTKWCTAAKNNPGTFERYNKDGFLCYLINKTDKVFSLVNKVAIYCDIKSQAYSGEIMMFDSKDVQVNETTMINEGWNEDELFKIIMTYRRIFSEKKKYKKSKDYVSKFISTIDTLDFDKLNDHIKLITNKKDTDFIGSMTNKFKDIKEKIKQFNYGH